jgi:hypothetical protein
VKPSPTKSKMGDQHKHVSRAASPESGIVAAQVLICHCRHQVVVAGSRMYGNLRNIADRKDFSAL